MDSTWWSSDNAVDLNGEVLSSNLDWDTSYPDWVFLWFYSVPTEKCQESTLVRS
jgi:hypothetical protein